MSVRSIKNEAATGEAASLSRNVTPTSGRKEDVRVPGTPAARQFGRSAVVQNCSAYASMLFRTGRPADTYELPPRAFARAVRPRGPHRPQVAGRGRRFPGWETA